MPPYAILWDLDGTITDSFDGFYEACEIILKKYDAPIKMTAGEFSQKYFGQSLPKILSRIFGDLLSDGQKMKIADEYYALANQIFLEKGSIRPVPGVKRVLDHFAAAAIPMAIASSSQLSTIVAELQALDMLHYFGNIISGNFLPSKPAPDIFQVAAHSLNVNPEACVVFEDSLAGIAGAKAAGMKAIGIATSKKVTDFSAADIALVDFDSLDLNGFENLFNS